MLCTNCGATNADDAKVCKSCDQPLSGVWQSPKSELVSAAGEDGEMVYGGFWERFAASFVDGFILMIIWMVGGIVLGVVIAATSHGNAPMAQQAVPFAILAFYAGLFLVMGLYFVLMESGARGATFGKRALKLRVVDLEGNRIGKGRATGRFLGRFLSNFMYIGYLIQPFTERKQALHDMLAGTVVVKTDKKSGGTGIVIAIVAAFFILLFVIGILAAIAIPAYQGYVNKAKMMKAETVGRIATRAVENYAAQNGKIPASLADTGVKLPAMPEVEDVTVNPQDGEVQVVLGAGAGSTVAGKALVFDATRGPDGKIVWTCSAPGIAPQMLPPDCR